MLFRQQIEIFEASVEDVDTNMRVGNKSMFLDRTAYGASIGKLSTYFQSTNLGVYQAAQNMSITHIANGLCTHMPASLTIHFAILKIHLLIKNWKRPIQNLSVLGLIDINSFDIFTIIRCSRYFSIF